MIRARWTNGRLLPEEAVSWPEGTVLYVSETPLGAAGHADESTAETPESIRRWLEWYDSLEPLVFTPEEEAAALPKPVAPGTL